MESISIFEIIKIGIGPSSSHTMGPWKAAELFLKLILASNKSINDIKELQAHLYGSLAKTGKGHGTDVAILMGLSGEDYTTINTDTITEKVATIKSSKKLMIGETHSIDFDFTTQVVFHMKESLPFHPNGLEFKAIFTDGTELTKKYYSVGGGFVATEDENTINEHAIVTPFPCHHASTILENCTKMNLSVSDLIYINEEAWRTKEQIKIDALKIWSEIKDCIYRGAHKEGILPGGLQVKRRAGELNRKLLEGTSYTNIEEWIEAIKNSEHSFSKVNKWVSCFALAVNEENAAFGRIITAPTNGAAGVIPAVLMYAYCFTENFDEEKAIRFILIAGEIGTLFKKNATISAAMGGCQAEIGVSSAMAAAALAESMGASPSQVLMAAEIAMEHHLGLTCDPIGGLVQIPCIERNSMGAMKAITACNLAIESNPESARVSLDDVIKSMWETAKDMNTKYKETSEGGLATNISVNVAEC
jgi:L-serine dehydratase